jgi:regulator of sirC expression with transglutaminase-like and TPR domain
MMNRFAAILALVWVWSEPSLAASPLFTNPELEAHIEAFFAPDRDLADVKFAADEMASPTFHASDAKTELDNLTTKLQAMIPPVSSTKDKLDALRKFIYEAGPWNGNRPFAYDHTDPRGKDLENHILASYMSKREGNCVSMPMLFMFLGNRIGLRLHMALAPYHVLLKLTDDGGKDWNIEATSGGGFSRDSKYRTDLPMTDKAIAKGTYLRALPREQEVAVIATIIAESYLHRKKAREAIVTSGVLLRHFPNSPELLVLQASAYQLILQQEIIPFYQTMSEIPPDIRAYADAMYQRNQEGFAEAEAIGWSENEGNPGVQP